MLINNISTGFLEIPNQISINIFTQGCTVCCKNCHNKNLWQFFSKYKTTQHDFELKIKKMNMANWCCWLGGEPTDQKDLIEYLKITQKHNKKNCVYTGKLFSIIDAEIKKICDIIIDGKYIGVPIQNENTNQKIYYKIKDKFKNITWKELEDFLC